MDETILILLVLTVLNVNPSVFALRPASDQYNSRRWSGVIKNRDGVEQGVYSGSEITSQDGSDRALAFTSTRYGDGGPDLVYTQPGEQYADNGQPYASNGLQYVGSRQPYAGSEPQYVGSRQPNVGSGQQYVGSVQPNVGSGQQYVGSGQPNVGSRQQYFGSKTAYGGSRKQYVGNRQPYSGSGQQYNGSRYQYVSSGKQYVGSGQPNAGIGQQYAGSGQQQFQPVDYPSNQGYADGGRQSEIARNLDGTEQVISRSGTTNPNGSDMVYVPTESATSGQGIYNQASQQDVVRGQDRNQEFGPNSYDQGVVRHDVRDTPQPNPSSLPCNPCIEQRYSLSSIITRDKPAVAVSVVN